MEVLVIVIVPQSKGDVTDYIGNSDWDCVKHPKGLPFLGIQFLQKMRHFLCYLVLDAAFSESKAPQRR